MESKKAAIEDFLGSGICKGQVERVCLDPDTPYMFLDLDRQVSLGSSILNIPSSSLVSLDAYLDRLFSGAYHVDGVEELERALMKVQVNRDQIDVRLGVGLEQIEADMTSLCNRITNKIADYFTDLIGKLQNTHLQSHKQLLARFDKLEQIMRKKIDLKSSVAQAEEFNLATFYNKFKIMQKEPEKLEKFLQGQIKRKIRYNAFAEEKDLQGFQDLYDDGRSFEENLIHYVENKRKFPQMAKHLGLEPQLLSIPTSAENALATKIIQFIESTVGTANHFESEKSNSEAKSKVYMDTLSKALQRAKSAKKTKTPSRESAQPQAELLPNTSPFNFSQNLSVASQKHLEHSKTVEEHETDTLVLSNATQLKQYLDSPDSIYTTQAAIILNDKHFTPSNCERAAEAISKMDTLESLKIEIADVHAIPAGRLNKLRQAIELRAEGLTTFSLVLKRSKLNKHEISAFGELFSTLKGVSDFRFDIEE